MSKTKQLKNNIMYQVTLISKGIKLTKICKSQKEVNTFHRDMPCKYGLLFQTKIPYAIQVKEL